MGRFSGKSVCYVRFGCAVESRSGFKKIRRMGGRYGSKRRDRKGICDSVGRKGLNVVLIARNLDKTEAVARDISTRFNIQTKVISLDIGKMGPENVHQMRNELQNLNIALLVNNAGTAAGVGNFLTTGSDEDVAGIVNLNARGVVMISRAVLPLMIAKKKGEKRYVINVGAIFGGVNPSPGLTVYGATKAFLDSFSIALHHEYKDQGIFVQSYIPGATKTSLMFKELEGHPLVAMPEQAVAGALAHLGLRSRTYGHWKTALCGWYHSWKNVNEAYIPHV
ncbi:very-long-chain 3-oxoacyl-CoA reductase-B-like [Paramacrobiotus metropolitanus]|uniref:very-long-chain 3-oxoacyl-CoA reductase-B-like n=1 Tax=Paramacrobiotus metropolitanus TaxID=2943436 RepID=UPI0024457C52|nr:very-long-chain 3-oxoacyl-CoA reductase-B-like [Paramacrobiotus metropolitanus]XP_055332100.1 very-long-chain 3-oxoacyl-CoA reductase-B-like [Paramacrobiotus metropolitanus]